MEPFTFCETAEQFSEVLLSFYTPAGRGCVPVATYPLGPWHCHCFKFSFSSGRVALFHLTINPSAALLMSNKN